MLNRTTTLVALVALVASMGAQGRELKLPSFHHLRSKATEVTDITLGSFSLALARWVAQHDDEAQDPELQTALKQLTALNIHHYEFSSDDVYSAADIDALRLQMSKEGWSSLAQIRNRKEREDVDIYLSLENGKATGFVLLANEPREFTIISAAGSFDPKDVEKLSKQFRPGNSIAQNSREVESSDL